jgi:hypothetical protein
VRPEVSTIRVSEWDQEAASGLEQASLSHPLTRMVLTSLTGEVLARHLQIW